MQSKKWFISTLLALLLCLSLCAIFVYAADPCFYYRWPPNLEPVFFNERYQNAGLSRNINADTVLIGTSMTANYHTDEIERLWKGTALKLTYPDGFFSDFNTALETVFSHSSPEKVLFGLDINILIRSESEKTVDLPEYLYNDNILDNVEYLLNKDSISYSAYVWSRNISGDTDTLNDAFTWDVWWNRETALAGYIRPEPVLTTTDNEAFLENCIANISVIEQWATEHPETKWILFVPPYSILYWDRCERLGTTSATLYSLEYAFSQLLSYDNIKIFFFADNAEIITNLDNYGDYIHHSGQISSLLLSKIASGEGMITRENYLLKISEFYEFIQAYNYDSLFT